MFGTHIREAIEIVHDWVTNKYWPSSPSEIGTTSLLGLYCH
jgi:hypothetical protein